MGEMKRGRLRWKRQTPERGLARVCAPVRGWDYHDGIERLAYVRPLGREHGGGWFWVARSNDGAVPLNNTCGAPVATPEEAKIAAMRYVKKCLAKATGGSQ